MVLLTDLVADFIDVAVAHGNVCQEALDWLEDHRNVTVEEGCQDLLTDPEAEHAWAIWTLKNIAPSLSTGVLVAFARKISDPMAAYLLDMRLDNSEVSEVLKPLYDGILEV